MPLLLVGNTRPAPSPHELAAGEHQAVGKATREPWETSQGPGNLEEGPAQGGRSPESSAGGSQPGSFLIFYVFAQIQNPKLRQIREGC